MCERFGAKPTGYKVVEYRTSTRKSLFNITKMSSCKFWFIKKKDFDAVVVYPVQH